MKKGERKEKCNEMRRKAGGRKEKRERREVTKQKGAFQLRDTVT